MSSFQMDSSWLDCEEDQIIDLSFPREFSEYFSSELCQNLKNSFEEIGEIWRLIGLPASKRDEEIDFIRDSFTNQINGFVQNWKNSIEKFRSFVDFKMKEINKILKDLSLPPFTLPKEAETLIAQNKILQKKYKELLEIKNDRMSKLESIESKLKKYCHILGIDYEPTTFCTDIPSEQELRNLATFLKNYEKTFINRKEKYDSIQSITQNLRFELEYSPETDDEQMILDQTKEFIFSQQNMNKLMDFNQKLINIYNNYKSKIEKLLSTLEQLYNRLDVSQDERESFFRNLTGTLPQQEKILLEEIAKYEIIKKNSIEKIINNIRTEILNLYNKRRFTNFNERLLKSEDFSEELLIELENEFDRLKKFDDHYDIVFIKFREFEDSLDKLIELERKSMDPNRFTNRGGALLQNERDRKMYLKKLPKLEKEIRSMINTIENETGILFNTYGFNIDEFFQSNWKHLEDCKNNTSKPQTKKPGSSVKSSAQKNRLPFSPCKINQQTSKTNQVELKMKKNLDFDLKKTVDPLEKNFQLGILKDDLHSTMVQSENHLPLDLHTPTDRFVYRRKELRRRSRSCEPSSKLNFKRKFPLDINHIDSMTQSKNNPILTESVQKRPPFLP